MHGHGEVAWTRSDSSKSRRPYAQLLKFNALSSRNPVQRGQGRGLGERFGVRLWGRVERVQDERGIRGVGDRDS